MNCNKILTVHIVFTGTNPYFIFVNCILHGYLLHVIIHRLIIICSVELWSTILISYHFKECVIQIVYIHFNICTKAVSRKKYFVSCHFLLIYVSSKSFLAKFGQFICERNIQCIIRIFTYID